MRLIYNGLATTGRERELGYLRAGTGAKKTQPGWVALFFSVNQRLFCRDGVLDCLKSLVQ